VIETGAAEVVARLAAAIRASRQSLAADRIIARLRALDKPVLSLGDVQRAIRMEQQRPFRTLDYLVATRRIRFIGRDRSDQRWVIEREA